MSANILLLNTITFLKFIFSYHIKYVKIFLKKDT